MPCGKHPAILVGLALVFALNLSGGAEARHHWHWSHYRPFGDASFFALPLGGGATTRHHRHGNQYTGSDDQLPGIDNPLRDPERSGRLSEPSGPVGALMVRFIHDCERQIAELKNFPMDAMAQSIGPNDAQDDLLKNAARAAEEAADKLAQSCPKDVPVEPTARLDALEQVVDAVEAALSALQPPVQAFYNSLNDEQKLRLGARYVSASGQVAETYGSTSRAGSTRVRQRTRIAAASVADTSPAAQIWDCEQWQAELRAWPVAWIERAIAVGPRQRAAFYELVASLQSAADTLADSCPREAALTPVGRIEDLRKKLDAVRQSAAAIRPALDRFNGMLDGSQRARFSDAM
jgi:hypothetical protein